MKLFSAFLIALTFLASPALAQNKFLVGNTQLLYGEQKVATAEYAWAKGRLSGYGFVDKSLESEFWITDHEVRANVSGPIYINGEVGYNHFGGAMGKLGLGINAGNLPVMRNHFVFLNVYAQKSIFGPDSDLILGFAFETKSVRLSSGVSVYASGFADFKHDRPDVAQPQVWLKFDKSPIEVGSEVSIFGKQTSISAAIKMNF